MAPQVSNPDRPVKRRRGGNLSFIRGAHRYRRGTLHEGAAMAITILQILQLLLDVAFFIMIVHIILSWLIQFQVLNLRQPLVAGIWDGLNRLLEPVYGPIRRMLPNTGMLDLAPLVVFIGIIIARDILIPNIARSLVY